MVFIVHKKDDDDQFLYETSCSVQVEDLLRQLVEIQNARASIKKHCDEIAKRADSITKKEGSVEEKDNLFTRTIAEANAFLAKVCLNNQE